MKIWCVFLLRIYHEKNLYLNLGVSCLSVVNDFLSWQTSWNDPSPCPKSAICPEGQSSPISCDVPFFSANSDSEKCQPTEELIALIIGVSVGKGEKEVILGLKFYDV